MTPTPTPLTELALDNEGRVLRRPNWYSAREYKAAQRTISAQARTIEVLRLDLALVTEVYRELWAQLFRMQLQIRNNRIYCRRRFHWLLRRLIK